MLHDADEHYLSSWTFRNWWYAKVLRDVEQGLQLQCPNDRIDDVCHHRLCAGALKDDTHRLVPANDVVDQDGITHVLKDLVIVCVFIV